MHAYLITRGQVDKVRDFMKHLETSYWKYTTSVIQDPKAQSIIQLGVRPIQLWEIAFPEEHLQEVINTIMPANFQGENKLSKIRYCMDKICWFVRKVLKLEDAPIGNPTGPRRMTANRGCIDVRIVGLKKDKFKGIETI